jgi:FAD/FMN-containing dehydrogenase
METPVTTNPAVQEFCRKALEWLPRERLYSVPYSPLMGSVGYDAVTPPPEAARDAPVTVVRVRTTEDVARLARLAYELEVPLCVRQATGYLTPDTSRPEQPGAVALDLRDLSSIALDEAAGTVEIGPFVTLDKLNQLLAPRGYAFPISVGAVTWGSLVGMNTSGQLVDAAYGKPGDYVLGLEVVLPDGTLIETGTRTLRKPCGPDLTRLFAGGQALFGVITRLRLRLVHAPREKAWGTATFDSLRSLGEAVVASYHQGAPLPRVYDFMDGRYMEFSRAFGSGPLPAGMLLLEMDGDAPGSAEWKLEHLFGILRAHGAVRTERIDREQWDHLAEVRYRMWPDFKQRGILLLVGEVIDSPLAELPAVLEEARALQQSFVERYAGIQCFFWGHIGSQSFHPAFAAPVAWPYEQLVAVATEIRAELLDLKLRRQASVGEQGIFPEHVEWFRRRYGEPSYALLQRIKAAFDPKGLFNPGRP